MKVIGFTGGIACGKSTASALFKEWGVPVWDADAVAHELTQPDGAGAKGILKAFGSAYFKDDGTLDRRKLGQLVFSDEKELKKLNSIMHPLILFDLSQALERYRADNVALVVVDAALLFETGIQRFTDEVWVFSCGVDMQLYRLLERGLTEEEAIDRIQSQISDKERRRQASRVIDTSGELEDTQRALRALYEELLEEE